MAASVLLALLLLAFVWFRLLTKMGFKGYTFWAFLIMLFIPFTALGVLLYLALFPWPAQKESVKVQRSQPQPRLHPQYSPEPVDPIDLELDQMRGDMGMNQMKNPKSKRSLTDLTPKRKPKQKREI